MPQTQTYIVSKTTPTDSQVEAILDRTGQLPTIITTSTEKAFLRATQGLLGAQGTAVFLPQHSGFTEAEETAFLNTFTSGVREGQLKVLLMVSH